MATAIQAETSIMIENKKMIEFRGKISVAYDIFYCKPLFQITVYIVNPLTTIKC